MRYRFPYVSSWVTLSLGCLQSYLGPQILKSLERSDPVGSLIHSFVGRARRIRSRNGGRLDWFFWITPVFFDQTGVYDGGVFFLHLKLVLIIIKVVKYYYLTIEI